MNVAGHNHKRPSASNPEREVAGKRNIANEAITSDSDLSGEQLAVSDDSAERETPAERRDDKAVASNLCESSRFLARRTIGNLPCNVFLPTCIVISGRADMPADLSFADIYAESRKDNADGSSTKSKKKKKKRR